MKKYIVMIVLLMVTTICLGVALGLEYTGIIELKHVDCNCKECDTQTTTTTNNSSDELDVKKLEEINSSDFNVLKTISSQYSSVRLLTNGKVMFDFDRYISNIDNAIDMYSFNGEEENLYILTKDGNIYKYFMGITNTINLEATKQDDFKNIKKIVEYGTRAAEAGGCDYLVAIDKDNNYKTLDHFCV